MALLSGCGLYGAGGRTRGFTTCFLVASERVSDSVASPHKEGTRACAEKRVRRRDAAMRQGHGLLHLPKRCLPYSSLTSLGARGAARRGASLPATRDRLTRNQHKNTRAFQYKASRNHGASVRRRWLARAASVLRRRLARAVLPTSVAISAAPAPAERTDGFSSSMGGRHT